MVQRSIVKSNKPVSLARPEKIGTSKEPEPLLAKLPAQEEYNFCRLSAGTG